LIQNGGGKIGLRSFIHRLTAPVPVGNIPNDPVKLVLVVNQELKMGKGKIAAQVGHASVSATMKAGDRSSQLLEAWLRSGQKKVCLKIESAEKLLQLKSEAERTEIQTVQINDAGKTQIPSGSLTVVAFGPDFEDKLEQLTGHLKLL